MALATSLAYVVKRDYLGESGLVPPQDYGLWASRIARFIQGATLRPDAVAQVIAETGFVEDDAAVVAQFWDSNKSTILASSKNDDGLGAQLKNFAWRVDVPTNALGSSEERSAVALVEWTIASRAKSKVVHFEMGRDDAERIAATLDALQGRLAVYV